MIAFMYVSAEAAATCVAYAQNDIENRAFYHARLFRTIIRTESEKLFKTVEWVITRDNDPAFVMALPLYFGLCHRNRTIVHEEEMSGEEPFNLNEEQVVRRNGEFVITAPDSQPRMAVFIDGELKPL